MGLEGYKCKESKDFLDYEFYSEGPKGKIKKVVQFRPYNFEGKTYFNLSFGDWDEKNKKIDDTALSDNKDRSKILVTVAGALLGFTERFPDMLIYAEGSTPSRTRLYQISIASNWNEINKILNVYGYTETGGWEPFRKKINYESFMVSWKSN